MRFMENGSVVWSREVGEERFRTVVVGDRAGYVADGELVYRGLGSGKVVTRYELGEASGLEKFPGKRWLVARQGTNLSFFSLEGERLLSFDTGGMDEGYQFTQHDQDRMKEIAYGDGETVHVVDITGREESVEVNSSLEESVFVGTGRAMLEAVALNSTAFVAEEYSEVAEEVNSTGLEPVGVGKASGIRSIGSVNQGFNASGPRYYAGSREKAVYVSALAAKDNASLTFDREGAERSFANYSIKELQGKFIQEFKPNHVAVADLDSASGTLAAYMAVKQGILPVNFDEEFRRPPEEEMENGEVAATRWNEDNGVIKLERKLERVFDRIGLNRNVVFSGRQVSLLHAPRKLHRDPVEQSFLDGDSQDGNYFYSDLSYGDLDGDGRLEAGVGRYPPNVGKASELFHRSLKREKGSEAVVAAEYMHESWPVILASLGGGMWDGKNVGYTLEQQGYRVTRLVEYRSEPVMFALQLLGVPTSAPNPFFYEFKQHQRTIGRYIGRSSVSFVKNAVFVLKGLERAQKTLQLYLEFDWLGWQPFDQRIEFPEHVSVEEMRELLLSFLPTRYEQLSEENLESELPGADVVFYQGIGDRQEWVLPGPEGYSGENSFAPREVPALERALVWDGSVNAGKRNGGMKRAFLESGAANYLGMSAKSYSSYTSVLARRFFSHGKTAGRSLKKSVNHLRSNVLVYHPTAVLKTGVREKMEKALSLYGNPETVKDPLEPHGMNVSRSCSEGVCELRIRLDPGPRILERNGRKRAVFNTSDYLLQPFAPITPLYSYRRGLPPGSEVISSSVESSYREIDGLEPARMKLLSHSGSFHNSSIEMDSFPRKLHRLNGSMLEYVQAAVQYRDNSSLVLEHATAVVRYRPPATVELSRNGKDLVVEVRARETGEAKLAYSIGSWKGVREVELEAGRNTLKLEELSTGIHHAEAHLYRDRLLSKDSATFRVAEKLDTVVFAPDMHVGSVRKVRAVVENPNSFRVEKKFELRLTEELVPGLLEDRSRTVSVDADGARELSWRVAAIRPGRGNVSLARSQDGLEVDRSPDSSRVLSPEKFLQSLASPRSGFTISRTEDLLEMEWKTASGELTYTRNVTHESSRIDTGVWSAEKIESGDRSIARVSTRSGTFTSVTSDGVTRKRITGEAPGRIEERLEQLDEEMEKLERWYQAREERMLKTNLNIE